MAFADPPTASDFAVAEERTEGRRLPKLVVSRDWLQWLTDLMLIVDITPTRRATVNLTQQTASIAATPLPIASLPPGLWRISVYARILVPATVSSSLEVTIGFTDGGVSQSFTGAAIVGNTTATFQAITLMIRIDSATPITYATTYGSVGGTPMQYRLSVVAEELGAETEA